MAYATLLSYVRSAPPRRLVYSLLASYGAKRGGWLPGNWFVQALEPFGHSPESIRQTVYRMTREGVLVSRRSGSHKLCGLSRIGQASTDVGTERMLRPPETDWDGTWTVVNYQFGEDRKLRDLVRGLLEVEGFAALSRGTFIHPRDRTERLLSSLQEEGVEDSVHVFRAERIGGLSDRELVRDLWDLASISKGYADFVKTFGPLARRRNWSSHPAREAVATRFAFVLRYLETAWTDPELPAALLPADWPAARAQSIASTLHKTLENPLLEYGDHVLETLPEAARRAVSA